MKKKTRNLIGKILVWGGLAWFGFETYAMQFINPNPICLATNNWAIFNIIAIASILFGGLWGMKE